MSVYEVRRELEDFRDSVRKLALCVNAASVVWNDEKFGELSESVRGIANMSKDVIVTGERFCDSLARFEAIAAEKL